MSKRLLPRLIVMLIVGCGSGGGDNNPATNASCTVTLSGAIASTAHCTASWLQFPNLPADPNPYIGIVQLDALVGFNIFQIQPKTGTYANGGGLKTQGIVFDTVTPMAGQRQKRWMVLEGEPNGDGQPDIGTYSIRINGLSDMGLANGLHSWNIDGSLDAVLFPDVSSGASDNISVRMDF